MTKSLHLVSLGCTKNLVDSEVMLGALKDYEVTDRLESADVIIVNTCGFIQSAKEESIGVILDAASRRKKDALIVASGCLTQRYAKELQEMIPEIDIITGVGDYDRIDEMIRQKKGLLSKSTFLISEEKDRIITGSNLHAYIKISEGCNQTCSFCAIPSFKGKLFSRTLDSVLKEVENLCQKGYQDFTFIAQDSSSYLRDKGMADGLIKLIEAIDKQGLARSARILYLYPSTTTKELIDAIARSKIFANYFDMPIQHIAESMLKRMKRGVSANRHKELLELMRTVPDSFVRSTVIVGHPGESEEEFLKTRNLLRNRNRGIRFSGYSVLDPQEAREENVINEINGTETDCILSVLHTPYQEEFISRNKALLNVRVWLGCGAVFAQQYENKGPAGRLKHFLQKKLFWYRVEHQNKEEQGR